MPVPCFVLKDRKLEKGTGRNACPTYDPKEKEQDRQECLSYSS